MLGTTIIETDTPFPAAGYRNNSNGSLNNVGSNGYYWSASPNNANNGRNLNFNSSNWNWNNNNRANGYSVRPVAAITTSMNNKCSSAKVNSFISLTSYEDNSRKNTP